MKHILSLILALCLVLSLGLFPALAEGEGVEPVDPPVDTGEGDEADPAQPENPDDPEPEEEEQTTQPLWVSLTITNKRGIPCLYRILDTEQNEVLCLLLLEKPACVAGLPVGDYTIQEIDILRGEELNKQDFSISADMQEPLELEFGSAGEIMLLRMPEENPWLRSFAFSGN